MIGKNGGNPVVDRLQSLLDRLGAPDLTLSEAKSLREEVLVLVAERAEGFATAKSTDSPRVKRRNASARAAVSLRSR